MIIDKEIYVPLYGMNIKYYESLGYEIPRESAIGRKKRMVVPKGTKILVNIDDLPEGSNENVRCKCDYCGKEFIRMYYLIARGRRDGNYNDSCGHEECTWLRNQDTRQIKYNSTSQIDICKANNSHLGRKLKYTIDDLIHIFEQHGLKLRVDLLTNIEHITVSDILPFVCMTHEEMGIQYVSVDMLKQHKHCCRYGFIEAMSGENNWNWQGGKENDERHSCEYRKWRATVFERDGFVCQCCGATISDMKLHAHHILNFAEHEDLKYDLNNGVTLCEKCHSPNIYGSFHSIYGTRNNTKEQLDEYINNKQSDVQQYKIN